MTLPAGTILGPYEILAPLGAGGMGEVYRARDPRLGREVAVKVLPSEVTGDAERLGRFEEEARAVSALNHPNILTIHDVGREADVPYAVSELLEGETLRGRLATGRLAVGKTVDYALQIAHGLAAAHEKGIVHRDLKPENLFVTTDERIKILDFGLAKRTREPPSAELSQIATAVHTEPGLILGTVGYLSPEQARGLPADSRSDIFAFGAVLYEMLSGRRAFLADSAVETMLAILSEDPAPLPTDSPGFPLPLLRIARRCLEKRPEQRFQLARDLGFALEALGGVPERAVAPRMPAAEGRRSVAVLPFRDLSRDPASAYLGVGLADATITELALLRSLVVRPTSAVLRYQDAAVDPVEAGRELGVDAVADGSFQRSGSRVRVTLQLVEVSGGRSLWGTKIDSSVDDVFQMQDEISRRIADALQVELSPADERRKEGYRRSWESSFRSLDALLDEQKGSAAHPGGAAYDSYLKGRYYLFRETLEDTRAAIEAFEEARRLDPGSALPLVALADAYGYMGFSFEPDAGWQERAERLCGEALALDPNLPEGRYLRARILWTPGHGFDHAGAIRELSAALAGRPNLVEAHNRLGIVLLHVSLLAEAIGEFDEAQAIDPGDLATRAYRGLARFAQGRYDEALELTESAIERRPNAWAHYQLAHCQIRVGRFEDAARTVEKAYQRFGDDVLLYPLRGLLAAFAGDRPRSLEQIALAQSHRKAYGHYHHVQYDVACIQSLLGDTERALDWLEQAARDGFPCATAYEADPLLEGARGSGRFKPLIERLRGDSDRYRSLYREVRGSRSGDRALASGSR